MPYGLLTLFALLSPSPFSSLYAAAEAENTQTISDSQDAQTAVAQAVTVLKESRQGAFCAKVILAASFGVLASAAMGCKQRRGAEVLREGGRGHVAHPEGRAGDLRRAVPGHAVGERRCPLFLALVAEPGSWRAEMQEALAPSDKSVLCAAPSGPCERRWIGLPLPHLRTRREVVGMLEVIQSPLQGAFEQRWAFARISLLLLVHVSVWFAWNVRCCRLLLACSQAERASAQLLVEATSPASRRTPRRPRPRRSASTTSSRRSRR